MKKMVAIVLLSTLILMEGCATSYQPKGLTGGFADRQISEDTFTITFQGNGFTSQDRSNELALVRAADVTIEHGFSYFEGLDMKAGMNTSYLEHPGSASTYGHFSGKSYYSSTVYNPPTVTAINRPETAIMIKCYVNDPGPPHKTFDARKIKEAGAKKYGLAN